MEESLPQMCDLKKCPEGRRRSIDSITAPFVAPLSSTSGGGQARRSPWQGALSGAVHASQPPRVQVREARKPALERQVETKAESIFRCVFRFSGYYLVYYIFSHEVSYNLSSVSFQI